MAVPLILSPWIIGTITAAGAAGTTAYFMGNAIEQTGDAIEQTGDAVKKVGNASLKFALFGLVCFGIYWSLKK